MNQTNPPPPEPLQHRSGVVRALGTMPGWKRKLLLVSLVIGMVGLVGQAASSFKKGPPPSPEPTAAQQQTARTTQAPPTPPGASGFISGQPAAPSAPAPAPGAGKPTETHTPTATEKVTPWMTRVGLSFFVGIVVGVIFRMFAKLTAVFVVVVAGIFMALSYFHILNIDMTTVRTEYASATAWLGDQVSRLKDVIFNALPSTTAAAAGFLSGLKKR